MRNNPPIKFEDIDLPAKYEEFRKKYFDIPTMPHAKDVNLRFSGRLKSVTGQARSKAILKRWDPYTRMVPPEDVFDYGITMSTKLRYDDAEFDRFFLHEMIHIALMSQGHIREDHGPRFRSWASAVGREAGFEIPLKHHLTGTEEVNARARKVGVLLIEPGGGKPALFQIFRHTTQNIADAYRESDRLARMLRRRTWVYETTTKAHALTKVRQQIRSKQGIALFPLSKRIAAHLDLTEEVPLHEGKP